MLSKRFMPKCISKVEALASSQVVNARGSYVYCNNGRRYLDFSSGIGATSTGHAHPYVAKAVCEQASSFVHAQQNQFGSHAAQERLLALLYDDARPVLPPHLDNVFFLSSGSEAIDNAIKLARASTRRHGIVAFHGGFHGRTLGALSVTTSKTSYSRAFRPFPSGVNFAPFPVCLSCDLRVALKQGYRLAPSGISDYLLDVDQEPSAASYECCNSPLKALRRLFEQQIDPHEVAAMIVEPVLGEGGVYAAPPSFLAGLREIAHENGILLIYDEVQCGFGRSGEWFAYQRLQDVDCRPDMLVFAKGIASGYPLAGVAAGASVFERLAVGSMGGTYGGNAVALAAARATIEVIQREELLHNVKERSVQFFTGLLEFVRKHELPIIDIRGAGLMMALEFCESVDESAASRVVQAAATDEKQPLLFLQAGNSRTLRFLPPLNTSEEEVSIALDTLLRSIRKALK